MLPPLPGTPRRTASPRVLSELSSGRLNPETEQVADDLSTYLKFMDDRDWGRVLARLDIRDLQRLARLLIKELP